MPDNIFHIKSKGQKLLEYFILTVCLAVMSLRATYAEAINVESSNIWFNINDNLISLIFTGLLLCCIISWLIWLAFQKYAEYRITSLEFAFLLFVIAGLVGINVASNKRAAINDFVTLTVPILTAIILVQILDKQWQIKLVLVILAALACTSAYQCSGQYFVDTHAMIEQYENNPQSFLNPLGIRPDSLEQWLFEHRIYTKGINGFLLTSNSVASFSILAFFAALGLFLENIKQLYKKDRGRFFILVSGSILFFVFSNFIYIRSKGGSAALIICVILFIILLKFGKFIKKHRTALLMLLMIIAAFGTGIIMSYGVRHGRLPGGNSMLVRWQYWSGTAQMFSDHQITGVGPGNFSSYYPHFKDPAAIETVKDPHNFVLSLLTQYGLFGVLFFIAMLFAPFWFFLKYSNNVKHQGDDEQNIIPKTPIMIAVIISVILLIARPILKPIENTNEAPDLIFFAFLVLYVIPIIVFFLAFSALWFVTKAKLTNITICTLLCGYIGVAIHNLLDFAIFEPAVYTSFWILISCLIALQNQNAAKPKLSFSLNRPIRFILTVVALCLTFSYSWFVLMPTAQSTKLISEADKFYSMGFIDKTQELLKHAGDKDKLDPKPLLSRGKIYLQFLERYGQGQKGILLLAEKSLLKAAERNPADFKAHEKLTEVYELLADLSSGKEKTKWLEKALDSSAKTIERYPNLSRIRFKCAMIAEQINNTKLALINYKQAVKIEDEFKKQFNIMYPQHKPISRFEPEKYNFAKSKIESLTP